MKVLIGCEFSQVIASRFRANGHDAYSCDLLPTEGDPRYHIQGNVLDVLNDGWDLGIFHPDCTYLTNAGVRWLTTEPGRFIKMYQSAQFFKALLKAPIPRIVVENPRPHGYAVVAIGKKYDQSIQPWMFGHTTSKETCFWLKNLAPLIETSNVYSQMMGLPKKDRNQCHYASPGINRWKERSRTYDGIADAMVEQWGNNEH